MTTTETHRASIEPSAQIMISADSHVVEYAELWVERLPRAFREQAPRPPQEEVDNFKDRPGGWDPARRLDEMAVDGVSAEVLYPSVGLSLYSIEDPPLQEACFGAYNDWLIEYCSVAPDRLVGVPMISMYNIEHAVAELERCHKLGLRGALIWQNAPPELPLWSPHYDPFWAAAQNLEMPVSMHILSGHGFRGVTQMTQPPADETARRVNRHRFAVNRKLDIAITALYDVIYGGALERFPRLKVVIVENEIGWIPFVLNQWDKYFLRPNSGLPYLFELRPSEYFERQVYATFFDDPPGCYYLGRWGTDNCMWSNDYPHRNSTWPNSRDVIARDLAHLSTEDRRKVLETNVQRLYGLAAVEARAGDKS